MATTTRAEGQTLTTHIAALDTFRTIKCDTSVPCATPRQSHRTDQTWSQTTDDNNVWSDDNTPLCPLREHDEAEGEWRTLELECLIGAWPTKGSSSITYILFVEGEEKHVRAIKHKHSGSKNDKTICSETFWVTCFFTQIQQIRLQNIPTHGRQSSNTRRGCRVTVCSDFINEAVITPRLQFADAA